MRAPTTHTLVVGGSGMLSELCLLLSQQGNRVAVAARREGPLERLVGAPPSATIYALPLDYTDESGTRRTLDAHVELQGIFDRTICWTHDEQARNAPFIFGEYTKSKFYQVLSSAYANPADPHRLGRRRQDFERAFPHVEFHTVILGFLQTAGGKARWLTHGEISEGVFTALFQSELHHVVGTISPWSARP